MYMKPATIPLHLSHLSIFRWYQYGVTLYATVEIGWYLDILKMYGAFWKDPKRIWRSQGRCRSIRVPVVPELIIAKTRILQYSTLGIEQFFTAKVLIA